MALNKRLFVGSAADCTTETVDIFGDSSGVALWSLDYDASETGGNFDGTVLGNVEFGVSGQINYGIQPQGANATDCIQLPANLSASLPTTSNLKNFAISMWVKSNATDLNAATGSNGLFVNQNGSYQFIGFGGNINSNFPTGKLFYYTYGGVGFHNSWIITPLSYADDDWHHLVVTDTYLNATGLRTRKLYVDNTLIVSDSVDKYFYSLASTTPFIGGSNANNAASKAHIDQVRIFNRDLTTAERTTLYQETACVHTATTNDINYPTTNLAYYKMDNSAEDEKGSYDGTTVGSPIYTFGRYGQAIEFTADSQYINTGLTPSILGTSFAASCWVYFESNTTGNDYYTIMGAYWNGSSGNQSWILWNDDGTLKFFANLGTGAGGGSINFSGGTIELFKWHHVAFSVDHENEVNLYLNNVKTTQSNSLQIRPNSIPLCLGNVGTYNASRGMIGKMDQVRVFDSTITDAQVTSLFNEKPATDTSNFKVVLYEGNGGTNYISNVGFQPDFVWTKSRTSASWHWLTNSIVGGTLPMASNAANGSISRPNHIQSFDANGFTLGADGTSNSNGFSVVAWVWKAGGDAVAGTGSGVSNVSVSANTNAGFSIVKYTGGNSASDTVNHGLTDAEMIILKDLSDGTHNWRVWHKDLTSGYWLYLNLTIAQANAAVDGGIRNVDSNSFGFINGTTQGVQAVNNSSNNYIAYVWKSIAGYSKIGTYEGLGTSTVTVSDVGFKPSFIMIKNIDATANWNMYDVRRSTVADRANKILYPNLGNSEPSATNYYFDMNNSGFVVSATNHEQHNKAGRTYLYMAFK